MSRPTTAQKARLGVFLLSAAILFVGGVAVLVGAKVLASSDRFTIRYEESVSGLETGAPVKLNGVLVGTVADVRVDPDDVQVVVVEVELDSDTPVMADTEAVPVSQGITGLKFIELRGGTRDVARLKPGANIPAGQSSFDVITGKAEAISLKIEQLVNNLIAMTGETERGHVRAILEKSVRALDDLHDTSVALQRAATELADAIAENRVAVKRTFANTAQLSESLAASGASVQQLIDQQGAAMAAALEDARSAFAAVAQAAGSLEINRTMVALEQLAWSVRRKIEKADVDGALAEVRRSVTTMRTLLESANETIARTRDDVRASTRNLRNASENFRDFTRAIREDPSRVLRSPDRPERKLP